MSDLSNPLRLEVVGVLRNGRRRYDPASKQRLVEACQQPGVSLAGMALRHGVCECRPNNPHLCRLKIPQVS
jgi:hypothetical protein